MRDALTRSVLIRSAAGSLAEMAHVSLILTTLRAGAPDESRAEAARRALEAAGHTVEVVMATTPGWSPGGTIADHPGASWQRIESASRGRAVAAVTGLQAASGDVLLVLDTDRGYAPADLVRVAGALDPARPELAVASRLSSEPGSAPIFLPKAALGQLLRMATGSTDPLSGLVGLTRPALEAAQGGFEAIGSQFALELLAKVRGRRIDVPARPGPVTRPRGRPGLDEVRHLKRLADHRFGNYSRLLQFCLVGASGMVVDLTFYALFQAILFRVPWLASHPVPPTQVPFALAIARGLAISLALVWNFSLNRRLTFNYARGGSILRQFVAYVLSNLLGVTVSMILSLGLPSWVPFFQAHKLVAAVVGIVAATGISFTMSRWLVFRSSPAAGAAAVPAASIPRPESARTETTTVAS